jgi:hypothetical protein
MAVNFAEIMTGQSVGLFLSFQPIEKIKNKQEP